VVLSRGDDGVLTAVMALGSWVKVPQIVSALDVAPSLVDAVIFGPAKALFTLDSNNNVGFSTPSFKEFLLDADRAGEYFIPSDKSDALFTHILSRQPPSDPSQSYSRDVLMGVLTVVLALGGWVKVHQIVSVLDVAPSVVEGVILGPSFISGLEGTDNNFRAVLDVFASEWYHRVDLVKTNMNAL